MLVAVTIILSLGTMVANQVNQLATELPRYQTTLREKVQNLRDRFGTPGVFKNAADLLDDLNKELDRPRFTITTDDAEKDKRPLPVEVHQPAPSTTERLMMVLSPLAAPLATIGIVLLFTTFFLFQREDLRNRVIRLAGAHDIERTTAALNDAGAAAATPVCDPAVAERGVRVRDRRRPLDHRRAERTAVGPAGDGPALRSLCGRPSSARCCRPCSPIAVGA